MDNQNIKIREKMALYLSERGLTIEKLEHIIQKLCEAKNRLCEIRKNNNNERTFELFIQSKKIINKLTPYIVELKKYKHFYNYSKWKNNFNLTITNIIEIIENKITQQTKILQTMQKLDQDKIMNEIQNIYDIEF